MVLWISQGSVVLFFLTASNTDGFSYLILYMCSFWQDLSMQIILKEEHILNILFCKQSHNLMIDLYHPARIAFCLPIDMDCGE